MIKIVVSLLYISHQLEMHGTGIQQFELSYCDLMLYIVSEFQFFSIYYSSWKFLTDLFVNFVWKIIMTGTHAYCIEWHCVPQLSSVSIALCFRQCSICYTAVQINSCSKSSFVTLWKIWMIFITKGSHHVPTTKLTLFTVSKDEWDKKEDAGKSMKNALYTLQYAKKTPLRLKWHQNSKKKSSL